MTLALIRMYRVKNKWIWAAFAAILLVVPAAAWSQGIPMVNVTGTGKDSQYSLSLQLLALSSALYGAQPIAHQLLVPASSMELGAGFSAALLAQLPEAEHLLRQWLHPYPPCTN